MKLDFKSTKAILRDCLKVVPFMKENNQNINISLTRKMILSEFRKNKEVQNQSQIEMLRKNAIIGMSNYYVNSIKEEYIRNKHIYDRETQLLEEEIK
jgi:hypothetical protein